MRIGIDATMILDSKPTGFGVYSINIVNELFKKHEDMVIWTVDDSRLQIPKNKIRTVMQSFRFLGESLYLLRPLWVELILPRLLKQEGIDVLYATIAGEITYCPIPQVVTVHDLIALTFPEDAPLGVQWNYKFRVPVILKKASSIIAVSEYTKNDIVRLYGISCDKIHTVHNGYDKDHFRHRNKPEVLDQYGLQHKNYILYVGNAQPRKNLARLIEAFSAIRDKIPHTLVLIGPKAPQDLLKLIAIIDKFHVVDRVKLLRYVPYEDLPVLYSGADLFTYLSLYEGFGLPVLEAMACGTPVLASNTTSVREVAGEAAVLVDPTDVKAINNALLDTILDRQKLRDLSIMGLSRCKEFSWRRAAEQILTVLKKSSPLQTR